MAAAMMKPEVEPLTQISLATAALERAAQALRHGGAIDRSRELRHADAYLASAALFRRRAAKRADTEQRAALERRAAWYEGRAHAKRDGLDMPRDLRTPAESLDVVDRMRQMIAELYTTFKDVTADEIAGFAQACDGEHSAAECAELVHLLASVPALVRNLGVRFEDGGQIYLEEYRRPVLDDCVEDDTWDTGATGVVP